VNFLNYQVEELRAHLRFLYPQEDIASLLESLLALMNRFQQHGPIPFAEQATYASERDAILITYADIVRQPGVSGLESLDTFLKDRLEGIVSTIHLLPFFPYSSDDGFSVIDYLRVDPVVGNWDDVSRLSKSFRLMFDAVINHISVKSNWFEGYRRGDPAYAGFFIELTPEMDVSRVFRPRALPLAHQMETHKGERSIWTTFSADQVDLNYANPQVLIKVLDVLLKYVQHGAEFIRLDAVAYLWKESGTSSMHLPQTHRIIQLVRTMLDMVAPQVALITETNVPHADNISYFGECNEAQMVYNFSLPPLMLHAFHHGNAEILSSWAQTLEVPHPSLTFFNFSASHDGIGLMPAKGILPEADVAAMIARIQRQGGHVSCKSNSDGSQTPYELNVNYLDALGDPDQLDEDVEWVAVRFVASQAIVLAMRGVPGIYFHSLFGSRNWPEGVAASGRNRSINRQKLDFRELEDELARPDSLRAQVFARYSHLLRIRACHAAFHPQAGQSVMPLNPAVFTFVRESLDGRERIYCLHNVSGSTQELSVPVPDGSNVYIDLVNEREISVQNNELQVSLQPYQVCWITERTG